VFPTRVFPNPKPGLFVYFLLPELSETRFFQLPNPGIFKNLELLLHILLILITLKLQIGAGNGQISTFELSTIIMRHEVRVLLGDHRTFVVDPLIFSFN